MLDESAREELARQAIHKRFGKGRMDCCLSQARDFTLDEMAAIIGTRQEMVSRLIYEFAKEGMIAINRTEFRIAGCDQLWKYAGREKGLHSPHRFQKTSEGFAKDFCLLIPN